MYVPEGEAALPGLVPGGTVVPESGAVEEAVVWQDFAQTYTLQLTPKLC